MNFIGHLRVCVCVSMWVGVFDSSTTAENSKYDDRIFVWIL